MDWPRQYDASLPLHIHTLSPWSGGGDTMPLLSTSIASFSWPAQNRGLYIPVTIPWAYPVARVFWANGSTATGNMCFAIFTAADMVRLYTSGGVAQSGASQLQYVDPTDFMLPAGSYYFFLSNDSATTTNRAFGQATTATNEGRICGFLQQGSVGTAPEKATPEAWASTGQPICGITRTASGF